MTITIAIDCSYCTHCSAHHCDNDHASCQRGVCGCPYAREHSDFEPDFAGCLMVGIGLRNREDVSHIRRVQEYLLGGIMDDEGSAA